MKISICIPTIRPTTLGFAVDSIMRQTWTNWELIIIGQGNDQTLQVLGNELAQNDSRIRYIHSNLKGVSNARNTAIEAVKSDTDIVAMTDDDCEARPDWLAVIADCFAKEPDLGLVGGDLVKPTSPGKLFAYCPDCRVAEALYDPKANPRKPPKDWNFIGANFAVRADVLKAVGPFDPNLGAGAFFPSAEDTDYKLRLEAAGVKMRSTPRAIVFHTYGYRVGIKSAFNHRRNYARGDGGLGAKLTMQGDSRGKEWLEILKRDWKQAWWKKRRPYYLITQGFYLANYIKTYNLCMQKYELDSTGKVLQKKPETTNKEAALV